MTFSNIFSRLIQKESEINDLRQKLKNGKKNKFDAEKIATLSEKNANLKA